MIAMNKGRSVAGVTLGMLLSLLVAPYLPTTLGEDTGQNIPPIILIFSPGNTMGLYGQVHWASTIPNGSLLTFPGHLVVWANVGNRHAGNIVYIYKISATTSWTTNDTLLYQSKYDPNNLSYVNLSDTDLSWSQYLNLTNIPSGSQKLSVTVVEGGFNIGPGHAVNAVSVTSSATVTFAVDYPPAISQLEPQNSSFSQNSVPLHFTIDKNASWIGYRLDNNAVFTLPGNTTLTGIADGPHSLVVYANDSFGSMGHSDTVFFTITTPTPSPSHTITASPTPLPSPSVAEFSNWITLPVLVVFAILIVYFKKCRRR
jgi:hypothetical protein